MGMGTERIMVVTGRDVRWVVERVCICTSGQTKSCHPSTRAQRLSLRCSARRSFSMQVCRRIQSNWLDSDRSEVRVLVGCGRVGEVVLGDASLHKGDKVRAVARFSGKRRARGELRRWRGESHHRRYRGRNDFRDRPRGIPFGTVLWWGQRSRLLCKTWTTPIGLSTGYL
jgi:hypothetical protein